MTIYISKLTPPFYTMGVEDVGEPDQVPAVHGNEGNLSRAHFHDFAIGERLTLAMHHAHGVLQPSPNRVQRIELTRIHTYTHGHMHAKTYLFSSLNRNSQK